MKANEQFELNPFLETKIRSKLYLTGLVDPKYGVKIFIRETFTDILYSIYFAKRTKICVSVVREEIGYLSEEKFLNRFDIELTKYLESNNEKINEEEPIMTKKSMQEIEYEQFAANKEAELKVRTQEIQHEIDEQVEQKRLECQEDMKRQQQYEIAANYWYFYQGLMEAGFNEDQAMKILLNKMPSYIPPMTCAV